MELSIESRSRWNSLEMNEIERTSSMPLGECTASALTGRTFQSLLGRHHRSRLYQKEQIHYKPPQVGKTVQYLVQTDNLRLVWQMSRKFYEPTTYQRQMARNYRNVRIRKLTKRDLFADSNAVLTIASGELGCNTELSKDED
jgi:hypothetical protein